MASNPFSDGLKLLDETLFPTPPPGYAVRLAVQLALCFLLFTLCGVYSLLHILYCRKHGKAIWFAKLQKPVDSTARGKLVLVNSQTVLVILAMAMSLLMAASRWTLWHTFISGHPLYNFVALAYAAYILCFLEAWFFSMTNLEATMAARRKFKRETSILAKPWVHNMLMIGIPIAWAVTVLLLALFENVAQTRLVNAGLAIRPVLAQAAESLDNKQNISLEAIVQVTSFQSYVAKKTRLANALIHALCALSLVACLSIIVTCCYSLILVYTLLQQVKANAARSALMSPKLCESSGGQVSQVTACTGKHDASTFNETALQRLTGDLSVAVPCITLIALVFTIGTCVILAVGIQTINPRAREFMYDSFTWATVLAGNAVVLAFLFNLLRAWRKGKGYYNGSGSSGTVSVPPATPRVISVGFEDLDSKEERDEAV